MISSSCGESDEKRAAGFALLLARVEHLFLVDVDQRDRCFRAIEFRIARGRENDLAVSREKIDRLLVPKRAQRAGEFFRRSSAAPS